MGTLDRTVDSKIVALGTRRHLIGTLLREHRGVYRVGHRAPSTEATYLAAVLAVGGGALLCGRAAAYMWGLVKGEPPSPAVIGVTERRIDGLTTRRTRRPDPDDVAVVDSIPVTAVARTLVDLAAELSAEALAGACHEAGVRYGTTPVTSSQSSPDARVAAAPRSFAGSSRATSGSPSASSRRGF